MRRSTRRQVFACAQKLFQDGQRIKDCQEWCESQFFPHWTQSAGTISPPPIMVCLLERAASVRVCVRVNSAVPPGPTVGSP